MDAGGQRRPDVHVAAFRSEEGVRIATVTVDAAICTALPATTNNTNHFSAHAAACASPRFDWKRGICGPSALISELSLHEQHAAASNHTNNFCNHPTNQNTQRRAQEPKTWSQICSDTIQPSGRRRNPYVLAALCFFAFIILRPCAAELSKDAGSRSRHKLWSSAVSTEIRRQYADQWPYPEASTLREVTHVPILHNEWCGSRVQYSHFGKRGTRK